MSRRPERTHRSDLHPDARHRDMGWNDEVCAARGDRRKIVTVSMSAVGVGSDLDTQSNGTFIVCSRKRIPLHKISMLISSPFLIQPNNPSSSKYRRSSMVATNPL